MRLWSRLVRSEIMMVIVAIVILVILLFLKPFIGVADNGDFHRLMLAGGIDYADLQETYKDRYFGYSHATYGYGQFGLGYMSVQVIIVFVAGLIGRILHSAVFDIRVLAGLNGIIYLGALYILVKYNKRKSLLFNIALVACIALVFLDIGYIAYFNSFFGEAVTLLFMLLTFALALAITSNNKTPSTRLLILFYVSAVCLIGTKLQNAPIGILIMLLGLRYWSIRNDRKWRKTIIVSSVVLLLLTVIMYVGAPKEFKQINLYQSVFFGILKDSPDPGKALKELGLPEEFKVNAGTNYFQTDTVIKQNDPRMVEALNQLSHKDVLFYYAQHPMRFVQKMERGAENGMSIRPYYLGSYDQLEGKPYGAVSFAYSTWSQFKINHIPKELWFIALFYAVYVLVLAIEYVRQRHSLRQRLYLETLFAVPLIGMFGFAVPLLGDGEADLGKHLFLFNVCFDMMIVTSVLYVVWRILRLFGLGRGRAR